MKVFNYSCLGESHKADEKPCQDASRSAVTDKGLTICIVSDGHGGEQYFRSDVGSKELVNITFEKVQEFTEGMLQLDILKDTPFTQMDISSKRQDNLPALKVIDDRFMQLFRAIKAEWMIHIYDHALNTPVSDWEREKVKSEYLDQLKQQRDLEKIYGATLMAYVQCSNFWFAFHLGDGKMIMFDMKGTGSEPVLWDDDCFLNKTTSICQADAIERFRYTFEGDGKFPLAVFLGSDGIDDTFTDGEPLYNFYRGILQGIFMDGDESVEEDLKKNLPVFSARGSRDDMSVAYCYDEEHLKDVVTDITRKQVETLEDEFKDQIIQLRKQKEKVSALEENNKDILQEVAVYENEIKELDENISTLTNEVKEIESKKNEIEAEIERRIQAIKDEYKEQLASLDEALQDKGTSLTELNTKKEKYNTPENKSKKKLQIDLSYAKSDIEKGEKAVESLVRRIQKLQGCLGEEIISGAEELINILFPSVETPTEDKTEIVESTESETTAGGDSTTEGEAAAEANGIEGGVTTDVTTKAASETTAETDASINETPEQTSADENAPIEEENTAESAEKGQGGPEKNDEHMVSEEGAVEVQENRE